jgi:hypothetical protein
LNLFFANASYGEQYDTLLAGDQQKIIKNIAQLISAHAISNE